MGKQRDQRDRDARKVMDEGAQARAEGKGRDDCPYHSRVELRRLWICGYESGDTPGPVGDVQFFGRSS